MSQKQKHVQVTQTQEADHRAYALFQLQQVFSLLTALRRLCGTCAADKTIQEAVLRNVVVLYGSVFKGSNVGGGKKLRLEKKLYVPEEYEPLHDRLMKYRDKLVAHFDLDLWKPEKGKAKDGTPYYKIGKSPILELKDHIPEIEKLGGKVLLALTGRVISDLNAPT